MAQTDFCPENLRFTQDSIKNTFKKPYEHQRIDDAVVQIGNNQLSPEVFMPLNVVLHRSVLWSLDNRRLWVLRKAGVPTVKVTLVPQNFKRRSEEFFSSLSEQVVRRYCSANYFSRVRGGVRSVGINRGTSTGGALRPPMRMPHHPTAVAGANNTTTPPQIPHHLRTGTVRIDIPVSGNHEATSSVRFHIESQQHLHPPTLAQANRPPSPPSQRPAIRDITVRSNIPQISALPKAYHQTRGSFVPDNNSCPGSDSLWGKILNAVNCVMEKGFGLFRFITSWAFDPCNENIVKLGLNSLIVLGFCFALRQANKLDQGITVNSKLYSGETIPAKNRGGSYENAVLSDQNKNNNGGAPGYLGIVAVKAVVGVEKTISYLLSKMFCFLRYVVRNAVDLSKGVAVGSGQKALDACSVILSGSFSRLHFTTGQAAVSFGRMGIRVSEFCLEKIWELLRFIKCQAFGLPGQMVFWSVGKVQDGLRFYMEEIKEFLRKVVCSPQIALSFCLNKVMELGQSVISFCLNKIKEFLGLQGL